MGKLTELAERCEKATGPDSALDLAISDALGVDTYYLKPWTASLDAAMTLVPDGAGVKIDTPNDTMAKHGFAMPCGAAVHFGGNLPTQAAAAATPALALCAAALRARTQNTPDSPKRDAPR